MSNTHFCFGVLFFFSGCSTLVVSKSSHPGAFTVISLSVKVLEILLIAFFPP